MKVLHHQMRHLILHFQSLFYKKNSENLMLWSYLLIEWLIESGIHAEIHN